MLKKGKYVVGIGLMRFFSRWRRLTWFVTLPLAPVLLLLTYWRNPQQWADDRTLARLGQFSCSRWGFWWGRIWHAPRKSIIGLMQLLQPTLPPVSGLEALARRCQAEQRGAIILGSHQKELLATARICQLEGLASRCFIGGRSMHNFATSHDAVPAGYRHPLWEVDPRQTCFSTVDQRKEAIKFLYQGGVLGIFPDVEVPASKYNTEVISLFGIKRRISTFAFRLALKKEVAVYFFARRWRSDNRGYDYALELMPPFETAAQGAAAYQACLREVLVGQEHDYSAWWWLSQRYAGQDGHPLPHCELDESHFATGEFAPPQN